MKRAEHQPQTVSVTIYGGIYYKVWTVRDAYTIIPQHSHEFDHLTAVLHGTVRAWATKATPGEVYEAPATIRIAAHQEHCFVTLTDNVVLACIHNADHAEADGEPIVAGEHQLTLED